MFIKKKLNFLTRDNFLVICLFLISLLINQHYGNKGVFPMDSFIHFDPAFRILNGEYPIKDYWVVHGIFIDYLQAIFFLFLGVSWKSYVFHASLFNGLLTVIIYFVLRNFKLNKNYCFIYSFFFSLLAYPSSGTPFLDHHSAFFSLLGVFCLILAIDSQKKIYWMSMPFFFGFAFLSKQVPSSYIILTSSFIILFFILVNKKFYFIKFIIISSVIFIIIILTFGSIQGISLESFFEQYIYFPQSIGAKRFNNLNFTFSGVFNNYKFIYLAMLPMLYINIKKVINNITYIKNKNFYLFLNLTLITFSLIFHQILTKNQIFIFFLIPILCAFSQIYLSNIKFNYKKSVFVLIAVICLFVTFKYHLRFNENRKFHELSYVDFNSSINAEAIDEKLSGLNWVSPFNSNPKEEIELAKLSKKILQQDTRNKMVLTDYLFFSAILDEKLHSPSRTYDPISYPSKKNKYFQKYKLFFLNKIKENKIQVIYMINFDGVDENLVLYDYLGKNCLIKETISKEIKKFEFKKC